MRFEPLIVEAEALDLVEIDSCRTGRDIERGVPDNRLVAQVLGAEEHKLLFAERSLRVALARTARANPVQHWCRTVP